MSILVLYKPADAVQYTAAGLAAHSQVLELVVPRKIVRRVGRDCPHPLGVFEPERIDKLLRELRLQLAAICKGSARAGVTSPTTCRSSVNE